MAASPWALGPLETASPILAPAAARSRGLSRQLRAVQLPVTAALQHKARLSPQRGRVPVPLTPPLACQGAGHPRWERVWDLFPCGAFAEYLSENRLGERS